MLHEETYNLMMAFSGPNYDAFQAFRFPIADGEFDKEILNYRMNYLKQHNPNSSQLSLNDPGLICKEWWDYLHSLDVEFHANDVKYATNVYYGSGFLKEVSFETALLLVEEVKQMPPPLDHFVTSFGNDGYFNVAPIFHFNPSPQEILEKDGKVQYATMRFNVKTLKQPPMPVFFRFYWLSTSNKWLPIEHAMPSSKKKHHSFCF